MPKPVSFRQQGAARRLHGEPGGLPSGRRGALPRCPPRVVQPPPGALRRRGFGFLRLSGMAELPRSPFGVGCVCTGEACTGTRRGSAASSRLKAKFQGTDASCHGAAGGSAARQPLLASI